MAESVNLFQLVWRNSGKGAHVKFYHKDYNCSKARMAHTMKKIRLGSAIAAKFTPCSHCN